MDTHEGSNLSICRERSRRSAKQSEDSCRVSSIGEWLAKFALNSGENLTRERAAGLLALWLEGFADVALEQLEAAFTACLRSHQYKTIPTVADVRGHLTRTGENALLELAAQEWQASVDYSLRLSPDYPDRNPPKISRRTLAAVAAAGGFAQLRECDRESLVWAGKRFTEAFVRYTELQQHQALLPDEAKKLLAQVAAGMALPALTAGA